MLTILTNVAELANYLVSQGFRVVLTGEREIAVPHQSLPVQLYIEFKDSLVYIGVRFDREELKSVLEDLHESGEDIESAVEEALSYVNTASLKARKWLEDHGYTPVFRLRDSSIEIYELLEDLLEELE